MLESLNTGVFEYKKLKPEEMQRRGILGRLVGVMADTVKPTRNGRSYSEKLWENVFNNPIMKERIENNCCFGELGHPIDREETDMEKIAICMDGLPKKDTDGKLQAVFNILDTPNGRILKTLCDYGCNIGISSRGSGDLIEDFDGNESVDPDTYNCEGWDAVLIPAVKEARLKYVTESLEKKRYNKTLRAKLQEAIDKEDEDNKKVMKDSLDNLGIDLDAKMDADFGEEAPVEDENTTYYNGIKILHSPRTDKYYCEIDGESYTFNNEKNAKIWIDMNTKEESLTEEQIGRDSKPDKNIDDVVEPEVENQPEEKEDKDKVTITINESIDWGELNSTEQFAAESVLNHVEEEPRIKNDLDELQYAVDSAVMMYNEANAFDEYSDEEFYMDEADPHKVFRYVVQRLGLDEESNLTEDYDNVVIGLYGGDDAFPSERDFYAFIDRCKKSNISVSNESYDDFGNWDIELSGNGTSIYKLCRDLPGYYNKDLSPNEWVNEYRIDESMNGNTNTYSVEYTYDEETDDSSTAFKGHLNVKASSEKEALKKAKEYVNSTKFMNKNDYINNPRHFEISNSKYTNVDLVEDVDDIQMARVNLCQLLDDWYDQNIANEKASDAKLAGWDSELQQLFINFRNELSPELFDIKEPSEEVDSIESDVDALKEMLEHNKGLEKQIVDLQEKLSVSYAMEKKLNEEIDSYKDKISKLSKNSKNTKKLNKQLLEVKDSASKVENKLNESNNNIKKLTEKLNKVTSERDNTASELKTLKEDYEVLNRDLNQTKDQFSKKFDRQNKLLEKYQKITKNAVDKYIDMQATHLGVKPIEIKNRLSEKFSFNDIDSICEDLRDYKLNVSMLPFNTSSSLNEGINAKAVNISSNLLPKNEADDLTDYDVKLMEAYL